MSVPAACTAAASGGKNGVRNRLLTQQISVDYPSMIAKREQARSLPSKKQDDQTILKAGKAF
jgi:hypothetical protein